MVLERTIATTRETLTRVFARRAPLRVLVESGTESEWVAQTLEALWPRGDRRGSELRADVWAAGAAVKTDRRDVAALAEACRLGIYRRRIGCRRRSAASRRTLRVREQLVRMRTQAINLLRAQLRQEGLSACQRGGRDGRRARSTAAAADGAARRCSRPAGAARAAGATARTATRRRQTRAAADPIAQRLMTAPGVGPITALTFRAVARDVGAVCAMPERVTAFLGLVPSEDSSGERQRKGAITKAGPAGARACSSKRRGSSGAAQRPGRATRLGRARSRRAAGDGSPSSRSPGAWRGSSTRCGATARLSAAVAVGRAA